MNRRLFLKALSLLIGSLTFRLSSEQVKELVSFNYGVASGDPTDSHVVLWTKLTKQKKTKVKVLWEVSLDKNFESTINSGTFLAKPEDDFTVKVDAKIPSDFNGKKIYYRFESEGIFSDIGITSTLPIENPQNFNIAFCSCSNFPAGYFNAYKEMANDKDIDLVLHLGDYIYEYSREGYASKDAKKMGRLVDPPNEIISLDDYRRRYATYRSDKDLQLLHRVKPMIVVWDDHEITNNTWKNGAQNHSEDEGSFEDRKANAIKAYYEWMPIRDKKEKDKTWRKFSVGNLINLVMLDTRLYGRDEQLKIDSFVKNNFLDKEAYIKELEKPRDLLGKEQLSWVKENIKKEYKWSIIGQQLLIGPKYLPEIFKSTKLSRSSLTKQLAGEKIAINTDQWDGYPKEREKFYASLDKSQSTLVLAGDSHSSWLSNLYNINNKFIGVEVGAPAISSPSYGDSLGDSTETVEKAYIEENEHLIWANGRSQGYVSLSIYEDFIDVSFKYVSTVKSLQYKTLPPVSFRVEHDTPLV